MLVVGLAMGVHGYMTIYEHIRACVYACVCMHSRTVDVCKHVPMVSMWDGTLILYMGGLDASHCPRGSPPAEGSDDWVGTR